MIDKIFVYEKILPLIEEKGRMIDVLLIQNLFENKEQEIIDELRKYQNEDLGFGNALEPDLRMPNSSVVATNIAVSILDEIKDVSLKEPILKDIVTYYESIYNEELGRFLMTTKEVDNYPHAVWWNYADLEKNFPFGNPDPEVIGFLYQNRKYVQKLSLNHLINKVITYIRSDEFIQGGMHSLMSVISFNNRVDKDVQNLIHERIHDVVDFEITNGLGKWDEYGLEPYKIYLMDRHFTENHQKELEENLSFNKKKVESLTVQPNWKWYQYEEEFDKIKSDWTGYLYFSLIKALRHHRG
jgi:hypothetical protein